MSTSPENKDTREFVDYYPTEAAAWDQAMKFARVLKRKGLTKQMGVTVKHFRGAWWVVLVKRSS